MSRRATTPSFPWSSSEGRALAVTTVSETETCDYESAYGKVELSVRGGRLVGARLCREGQPGQTRSPRPAPSREMRRFLDALAG